MAKITGRKCNICNKLYAVEGTVAGHKMDVVSLSVKDYEKDSVAEYKDICPGCSANIGMILRNLLAQRVRSELEVTDDEDV